MAWVERVQRAVFAGHELPPDLRARIALLRERAAGAAGLTLTCAGRSMEPAIRLGDAVLVRPGEPRPGVVAAFVNRRGYLELHRLVLRAPGLGWWVHAGDNQVSPELGLVHAAQLVGVAEVPRLAPGPRARARAAARVARAAVRVVVGQPR